MTNPTLKAIPLHSYYLEELKAELTAFSSAVDTLDSSRSALAEQATDLRRSAIDGTMAAPEKIPALAGKLTSKSIGLDVEEIQLLRKKKEFQPPIIEARRAERERLLVEAKGRIEELEKGLDAVDADSRYRVGLVRGDSRVVQLQHAAQALGTFLRVTSEEDEQRLAILLDRIAAAVPDLSK